MKVFGNPNDVTRSAIENECEFVKNFLCAKNAKYGNSAISPEGVFGEGDPLQLIAARCDDKLSRIKAMGGLVRTMKDARSAEEDTVLDLIGYLILARVVVRQQSGPVPRTKKATFG